MIQVKEFNNTTDMNTFLSTLAVKNLIDIKIQIEVWFGQEFVHYLVVYTQ